MRLKITTPVEDFAGEVAGIAFVHGAAEVDVTNSRALAYFQRHGYGIEAVEPEPAEKPARKPKAKPETKPETPAVEPEAPKEGEPK